MDLSQSVRVVGNSFLVENTEAQVPRAYCSGKYLTQAACLSVEMECHLPVLCSERKLFIVFPHQPSDALVLR